MAKAHLYNMLRNWEQNNRDPRDAYPYASLLDELAFQAELRFCDYVQYEQDGPFLVRLERWLSNLDDVREQQMLFRLLEFLIFIDKLQMKALYRDAFRRIIGPWLTEGPVHVSELFVHETIDGQRAKLARYQICSISESCDVGLLLKASDLHGIPRPLILGPDPGRANATLETISPDVEGLIICEDIVGTGKQASKIIAAVEAKAPASWRVLFTPLIAFEDGVTNLKNSVRATISPVVTLPRKHCLTEIVQPGEPDMFKAVRGIVKNTSARVIAPENEFDAPPRNPFGYEGTGGLIVTCHNAPNNTLPLIHHTSPTWHPIFRRLHHKERGL